MKLFRTAILIFSVVLWGCIGEDLDNCPPDGNLVLRFSYVIDGNEVFLQRAEKTSIFIFDERGYFVREETIGANSPDAGRSLSLSLSPGTYNTPLQGVVFPAQECLKVVLVRPGITG